MKPSINNLKSYKNNLNPNQKNFNPPLKSPTALPENILQRLTHSQSPELNLKSSKKISTPTKKLEPFSIKISTPPPPPEKFLTTLPKNILSPLTHSQSPEPNLKPS